MKRISQYAIIDITDNDISKDVDLDKLYVYDNKQNQINNKQIIQDDTTTSITNQRKYTYSPIFSNVLLGTTNFYPDTVEVDYHSKKELSTLLNDNTLPSIEFKKCRLLMVNGFLSKVDILGVGCRVYVKLSDGSEVTLSSLIDLKNDTNISITPSVLFENDIFSEAIEFEILDLDFMFNSNDVDVIKIKELIFGENTIDKLYVDFSVINEYTTDVFEQDSKSYTKMSFDAINTIVIDTTMQQNDLYANLTYGNNNSYLLSSLEHTKFDVESYLNNLKNSNETYTITHNAIFNVYDSANKLIETRDYSKTSSNIFDPILHRPVVSNKANHMLIDITITVKNESTGISINRNAKKVIPFEDIRRFMSEDFISLTNTSPVNVNYLVNKKVNHINRVVDTPKTVTIERKYFINVEGEADTITLMNGNFICQVNTSLDLSNLDHTYLKVGSFKVKNMSNGITTYKIPSHIYNTTENNYYIVDKDNYVITKGSINR